MIFFIVSKKIRTKSVEAGFRQKIKNIKKCWNPKNIRTFEAQPIFTGSYKKKSVDPDKSKILIKCKNKKIAEIPKT